MCLDGAPAWSPATGCLEWLLRCFRSHELVELLPAEAVVTVRRRAPNDPIDRASTDVETAEVLAVRAHRHLDVHPPDRRQLRDLEPNLMLCHQSLVSRNDDQNLLLTTYRSGEYWARTGRPARSR